MSVADHPTTAHEHEHHATLQLGHRRAGRRARGPLRLRLDGAYLTWS